MRIALALALLVIAITRLNAADEERPAPPASQPDLVSFKAPWTSPFRVDPSRPHHLVNAEGRHLFILNKTAWAYFLCKDPKGVLDRAEAQGVSVLRVALEGTPYLNVLNMDLWPWAGTRSKPDWSAFNEAYWDQVEQRIRLAGERGIGLDIVLYFSLHPTAEQIDQQRPYWQQVLRRLAKYANVLTWEIANEYTSNEKFQDAAGEFLARSDPFGRPVCTSAGTTSDAVWPKKAWMGLAINHSCTGSKDLAGWYLASARRTRSHGKPAWCNESGREKRHGNDDGVHRRKQGWVWCAAGCFWTWHSWDGCEGIDDKDYRAPGAEFVRPMAEFFRGLPFWEMSPDEKAFTLEGKGLISTALATDKRDRVVAYVCTAKTGQQVDPAKATLTLPEGQYHVQFIRPVDGSVLGKRDLTSQGESNPATLDLPRFTDDLAIHVRPAR